jgi:hypothetical protein
MFESGEDMYKELADEIFWMAQRNPNNVAAQSLANKMRELNFEEPEPQKEEKEEGTYNLHYFSLFVSIPLENQQS